MTRDIKFFAASGVVHSVVAFAIVMLANFHMQEEEVVLTLDFSQAVEAEQQPQQQKAQPKLAQPQKPIDNLPTPNPVVAEKPLIQPITQQTQTVQPVTQAQAKQVAQKADLEKEYLDFHLQVIRKLLAEHRKYPRNARVLGQEGDVEVSFRLNSDGSVEDISVVKSSTYEMLDNAARELIASTAKLFPRPPKTVRVRVPLKYALQ